MECIFINNYYNKKNIYFVGKHFKNNINGSQQIKNNKYVCKKKIYNLLKFNGISYIKFLSLYDIKKNIRLCFIV